MLFTFFRNFFVFLNCIYVTRKLMSLDSNVKYYQLTDTLFAAFLSIISLICKFYITWTSILVPFIVLCIAIYCKISFQRSTLGITLISFSISYCSFTLAIIIVTLSILLPFFNHKPYPQTLFMVIVGMVQCLLIYLILKIKRFQHGMPFMRKPGSSNIGAIIGSFILIIYTFAPLPDSGNRLGEALIIFTVLVCFNLIIHWWQSQLTKSYQKYLRELELESMHTELQQNAMKIKELEKKNEELGRLIHKDNKLIPAMEHAVSEYLSSGSSDAGFLSQGQALLTELKELAETRKGILDTLSSSSIASFQTGIPALNIMLSYMSERARANNISFSCTIIPEALNALPVNLPSGKLSHLLSDLLENSIIACSYATVKQIQLQIYQTRGFFTVEISDSGIPFEIPTLISFGLKKASTHLDHGGSGIGLMDIWKIKEETHASIHIHEYETASPFSKKIYLVFDKKSKYIIHTWRDQEIVPLINRNDLILFSASESFT